MWHRTSRPVIQSASFCAKDLLNVASHFTPRHPERVFLREGPPDNGIIFNPTILNALWMTDRAAFRRSFTQKDALWMTDLKMTDFYRIQEILRAKRRALDDGREVRCHMKESLRAKRRALDDGREVRCHMKEILHAKRRVQDDGFEDDGHEDAGLEERTCCTDPNMYKS